MLKIMFSPPRKTQSLLRTDIREDRNRAVGQSGGGDFYVPFWSDAKQHVFGEDDLSRLVENRIAQNFRRRRLYPILKDGFLDWWDNRRRWTNHPFIPGRDLHSQFELSGTGAIVKVSNILSVQDADGVERAIYPYFSETPILSEHAARYGLWLISSAFPDVPQEEFRILDVIRGRTFSLERTPLHGTEEAEFRERVEELIRQRDVLREEYD